MLKINLEQISTLALDQNLDIFAVSETWLNHSIASDSFSIDGFSQIYRLDRCDGRRAGGVALYISSSFATKRRFDLEHVNFELLFVEIVINSITFVCGVCYRPPNYNAEDNNAFLDNLQSSLDNIYLKPDTFVLLLGDFNAHYDTAYPSLSSVVGTRFYSWMACNNLFQVINEPTRITSEGATLLDLIITNSPGYFVNSGTLSPPSNCDHLLIYARMNVSFVKLKSYTRHVWDLSRMDENVLQEALSNVNWNDIFLNIDDIDHLYAEWFKCFYQVLLKHVPHRTVTIRPRDKPWVNSEIRRAIRKRNRLLKYYCRHKSPEAWEIYRRQRNFTTTLIRKRKLIYYDTLNAKLQNPKIGPKKWWSIVKSLYGSKIQCSTPTLIENNCLVSDAKEKAALFNDYFVTQSRVNDTDATLPNLEVFQSCITLSNISTSEYEVKKLLQNVDTSKACGADGVGNALLKASANNIACSFSRFINQSLFYGCFPFEVEIGKCCTYF